MSTSPTQRTLKLLRDRGYVAGVVERFNAHVGPHGIRQDFCGGIDVIAFKGFERVVIHGADQFGVQLPGVYGIAPGQILGIQVCADSGGSGVAEHRAKLLANPKMREWVAAGGRLVIWAWGKKGERGKRKPWTCREVELRLDDFQALATPGSPDRIGESC